MGKLIDSVIDERKQLRYILTSVVCRSVNIEESWSGVNVYEITDLPLLVEWWNRILRHVGYDPVSKEVNDRQLRGFHNALWVRINLIHPKQALSFADITRPELVRR